jgi:hypothetical protein
MATHFLLSAAARTLSLAKVARMTEEEGRETFRMIRWANIAAVIELGSTVHADEARIGTRSTTAF